MRIGRTAVTHWVRAQCLIILLVLLAPARATTIAGATSHPPTWVVTGPMHTPRNGHTATLLPNGTVLVVGGYSSNTSASASTAALSSAEVYVPRTKTWEQAHHLHTARSSHRAVLLRTGKVLVVGGYDTSDTPLASAELYDPGTGTWAVTGSMATGRVEFAAVLLPSGRVLVVGGGVTASRPAIDSAELYDPRAGHWTATGRMVTARSNPTLTLLPNALVLVAGGRDASGANLVRAELYNPRTGTWRATGSMHAAHYLDTATLLLDGRVLIVGAAGLSLAFSLNAHPSQDPNAEIYDPQSGTWRIMGAMATNRGTHAAALLQDGTVLVVGGSCGGAAVPACPDVVATAEVFHPSTGRWTPAGRLHTARLNPTATTLPDGTVLVTGGIGDTVLAVLASVELFDPHAHP